MSDISILNHPLDVAFILAPFGAPGVPFGSIAGALAWRRHRVAGAILGAIAGFVLCLVGWLYFTDSL